VAIVQGQSPVTAAGPSSNYTKFPLSPASADWSCRYPNRFLPIRYLPLLLLSSRKRSTNRRRPPISSRRASISPMRWMKMT